MTSRPKLFTDAAVLLYPLLLAIFSGAVLCDMVYSRIVGVELDDADRLVVYSGVADALLFLCFLVTASAIPAIVFSWRQPRARLYFILGLCLLLVFELLLPMVFFPAIKQVPGLPAAGPWIRLSAHALALILVFSGLRIYLRVDLHGSLAGTAAPRLET